MNEYKDYEGWKEATESIISDEIYKLTVLGDNLITNTAIRVDGNDYEIEPETP